MPPFRNVNQDEAVKAFCRLGGVEKRGGKGSHKKVEFNGVILVIPHGIVKIGLLKYLIKCAGVSEGQFQEAL